MKGSCGARKIYSDEATIALRKLMKDIVFQIINPNVILTLLCCLDRARKQDRKF